MTTSKTLAVLPFLPTHKLTAELKGGVMTQDVMAVLGTDGVTRLFSSDEVGTANKAPEWRAVGTLTSTYELQRNRKTSKGASLARINDRAVYFVVQDKEIVPQGVGALPHLRDAVAKVIEATQDLVSASEEVAAANPDLDTDARDQAIVESIEASDAAAVTRALEITNAKKSRKKQKIATVKDAPAPVTPAAQGPRLDLALSTDGPKHRAGSVQGMSVEELRAEFTTKTGKPAPSNSIHYMRKMVLAARRGKTEFKNRTQKIPMCTIDANDATALVAALAKSKDAAIHAITERLSAFLSR